MKILLQKYILTAVIILLVLFLAAILIFAIGMKVGYRKAMFSYHWNDTYAQEFGGPRSPFMMMDNNADETPNPHGAFGTVIAVRMPNIVIKNKNEAERLVNIGTTTVVRRFHDLAASTTIRVGDNLVILGNSDDNGYINATFIRIVPSMMMGTTSDWVNKQ